MTDTAISAAPRRLADNDALVARRYRAERRFKLYGIAAIAVTAVFLVLLFADILAKGLPAFFEHRLTLPITVSQESGPAELEQKRIELEETLNRMTLQADHAVSRSAQ